MESGSKLQPDDAIDEETIDNAVPCLITATEEAITTEHHQQKLHVINFLSEIVQKRVS